MEKRDLYDANRKLTGETFVKGEEIFFDDYYIKMEVPNIKELKLQKEEVESVHWFSEKEIKELMNQGKFFENHYEEFERLLTWQKKKEKPYNKAILEKCLPKYLENDIKNLKEGLKNNVSYIDCLINEVQGSTNSAFVDGDISEEQCDYIYEKYIY